VRVCLCLFVRERVCVCVCVRERGRLAKQVIKTNKENIKLTIKIYDRGLNRQETVKETD